MLRFIILCVILQPAFFINIEKNYYPEYEDEITEKSLRNPKKSPKSVEINEESHITYSSDEVPAKFQLTRRSRILKLLKPLLSVTEAPQYVEKLKDMKTPDNPDVLGFIIRLVKALDVLNNNIKCSNNNELTERTPFDQEPTYRKKRQLSNSTENNITEDLRNSINNVSSAKNSSDMSDEYLENDKSSNENNTAIFSSMNNKTSFDSKLNGRRSEMVLTPPIDREKMLADLDNIFIDIEQRIQPLTKIKTALANDLSYRIGYIIANIDTLVIQLRKLKTEMNINRIFWNEAHMKEISMKVNLASELVLNLLAILASYLS